MSVTSNHVHGPDCQHEHEHKPQAEHVHGPDCNHDHEHDHHHSHEPATPHLNPLRAVGRNDACPCGSGQKFKKCHGR